MAQETYLGDGLYASFDGWQIKLRAPREGMLAADHEVYLEPEVYRDLVRFATKCYAKREHQDQASASEAAAYRIAEDNSR